MSTDLDVRVRELALRDRALAEEILREAVRLPADFVDRPPESGGDPECGLSNHEGPRLEYLRARVIDIGAVDGPGDVGFDAFGNLSWTVSDPDDGVPADRRTVIWLDGHTDTVKALPDRWREAIGGGIDAYRGLVDKDRMDLGFLRRELGWLPPDDELEHLIWGRGSADQLGGVVCQLVATRILRELRPEGALRGVTVVSHATVAEEDNDGGGPMYLMRESLPGAPPGAVPDVVILSEPTGSSTEGALGIYRGQRGRMQIEVRVTGKSCHGSMPWEGRNPLEFGGAIVAEAARHAADSALFGDDPFLGRGSRTASWARLDTPSDCAVPERFVFRLDRRLTAGEEPEAARRQVEELPAVAAARAAGLEVEVAVPTYEQPTWTGHRPGNPQVYPGWVTPADHPALRAAEECYRRAITPQVERDAPGGGLKRAPRTSRWIFSTDGVGVPVGPGEGPEAPEGKRWVRAGGFRHPAMFGLGPGIEQNTHKIGECVDARELAPAVAFLARYPSLYRERAGGA
ncbi:MAG: M20/M25/M40 family metallo-hydrolase [Thermoanaerobaculia bacterium]|nr:M20/M25/M40 family metallo-hydrolase [Thermoanaerobaculia bacterium]